MTLFYDHNVCLSHETLCAQYRALMLLRRKRLLLSDTIEDAEYEVITQ